MKKSSLGRMGASLLLLGLLFFTSTLFSQQFEWASEINGDRRTEVRAVQADDSGNVYLGGFFRDTTDFAPGPAVFQLISNDTGSGVDAFICKLDSTGHLLWAHDFGNGTGDDFVSDLMIGDDGFLYAIGTFRNTVDFDPGPNTLLFSAPANNDIFLLKLSLAGNLIWGKAFHGRGLDFGNGVTAAPDGSVYITGSFDDTLDMDPGPGIFNLVPNSFSLDQYYCKLDSGGNFLWAKQTGGIGDDYTSDLTLDSRENLIVTGYFEGNVDFDPGPGQYFQNAGNTDDPSILKLDSNGTFIWARYFSTAGFGSSGGRAWDISVDSADNVYTAGQFSGTGDFSPWTSPTSRISEGGSDIFLTKLDSAGNLVWVNAFGSSNTDIAFGLQIDPLGEVAITGFFSDSIDFDPGPGIALFSAQGSGSGIIGKYNLDGDFLWARSIGNTNSSGGSSVAGDQKGNVYVGGNYNGQSVFFPGLPSPDTLFGTGISGDGFVTKLSQCQPAIDSISPVVCDSFISLAGNVYTTSGIYVETFSLPSGCDSIATIDLTVSTVDTSVSSTAGTLTANANGATFQWLDCANNFSPIANATSSTFSPLAPGDYAVQVLQNGCLDTSACTTVIVTRIEEIRALSKATLFPNPAKEQVIVDLGQVVTSARVEIWSMAGQRMLEREFSDVEKLKIPLQLEAGVYMLNVSSEWERRSFKLVVLP